MISKLKKIVVALVAVAGFTMAQAATVHIKFDDPLFTGMNNGTPGQGLGYDSVKIFYPSQNGNGTLSEWAWAGRFEGTASKLKGVAQSVFVNNINDVYMYCYDVYESIEKGQDVDYTINFNGATQRTLNFLGAVNYVLNGNTNTWTDPFAWVHISNQYLGAAIQLGIWESKYDTSSTWSLTDGLFYAENLDTDTQNWWDKLSAAVANTNVNDLDAKYAMTLEAKGAQDMITGDPQPVPEPGSLALISLALAGVAAVRRRSIAVAQA